MAAAVLGGVLACTHPATAQDTNAPAPGAHKKGAVIEQRMHHLDELLSLTDDQKPKVRAALEAFATARREARDLSDDDRREKMRTSMADMNKKMKEILTPDQYDKWLADAEKGKKGGAGGQKKSDSSS
jgi:Spy/CpxP family protein refolding chaperone